MGVGGARVRDEVVGCGQGGADQALVADGDVEGADAAGEEEPSVGARGGWD